MTSPLTPSDQERLTPITDAVFAAVLSGELFPGAVIVTEIREPVAPEDGALVLWDDGANEGVVIQRLYTDKDRAQMRRRMLGIVEDQTKKG